MSRIALGTVQFGLPYGVANTTGEVEGQAVAEILDAARASGVDTIDTAMSYGSSEAKLGEAGLAGWRVVTKLPAIPASCPDVGEWVRDSVAASLARLRIATLDGLLLHRPAELLASRGDELFAAMEALKVSGSVQKLGVSVYSPEELDALCARFHFDLVQLPLNVVDRRFIQTGWLRRLAEEKTEIHTRSVFLQGLLLMDRTVRPKKFDRWQSLWMQWQSWLNDSGVSAVEACLAFVLSQPGISRVVVGVESRGQLSELLLAAATEKKNVPPADLAVDDERLLNPASWAALEQ